MSDAGQPSGPHGLEVPKRGKERPDPSSVVEMRGTHRRGREHTPWRVLAGLERELVGNISTLCMNVTEISTPKGNTALQRF